MNFPTRQVRCQSEQLSRRMRMGTGVSTLLHQPDSSTHYVDALERFQKDYAKFDKIKRDQQLHKKHQQIERRRILTLQREYKRFQLMQDYQRHLKSREEENMRLINSGVKRTANRNGLAYNPINLQYENNPEGRKLKLFDEQQRIKSYVRSHNMDRKGNSQYNIINGQERIGIDKVVPQDLRGRYEVKRNQHYQNQKIKLPHLSLIKSI